MVNSLVIIMMLQAGVVHGDNPAKKKDALKAMFEPEQSAQAASSTPPAQNHAPRSAVNVEAKNTRQIGEPDAEPDPSSAYPLIKERTKYSASLGLRVGAVEFLADIVAKRINELRAKCLKVTYEFTHRMESYPTYITDVFVKCLPRPVADVGPLLRQFKCEELTSLPAKDLTPSHTEQYRLLDCLGKEQPVEHRAVPPTKFDDFSKLKLVNE